MRDEMKGSAVPTYRDKLYPLCERLGQTALQIASQCDITITERGFAEPKILALTLLCRTLSNFKGTVSLIESNLVVEARVLARCCFENLFIVGGLYENGLAFTERMKADD